MLNEYPAYAILAAEDLDRVKAFYTDKLGFEVTDMKGVIKVDAANGTKFIVYEKEGFKAPVNTVLGFDVKNLDGLLAGLKAKGVEQDMRDLPEGADANGVVSYGGMRCAWINDSEGNIIGLNESGD